MTRTMLRFAAVAALIAVLPFAAVAQTQPAKPAPAQAPAAAPAQSKLGQYPTPVVDAFVGGCGRESGGRVEFCRCLIDGLQKKLSFSDFKRWETAGALGMQVAQSINERVLDVATQCRWPD